MPSEIQEAWAMTHDFDNRSLAYIDGGDQFIYKANSLKDFEVFGRIEVVEPGMNWLWYKPILGLNEIEFVGNGKLWVNQYGENHVYVIDVASGEVVRKFDFGVLWDRADWLSMESRGRGLNDIEVMNGIAYDLDRGTIYLTGKYWRVLFEIELVD